MSQLLIVYSKSVRNNSVLSNPVYRPRLSNSNLHRNETNLRGYATLPVSLNENKVPKIKNEQGAIWISKAYFFGSFTGIERLVNTLLGRRTEFVMKKQQAVANSFDELLFPGLRNVIPSFKEGGCFVVFVSKDQAKQVLSSLDGKVDINGQQKNAFYVQGRPFIEDLSHVHPAKSLIVEIVDPAKSVQRLSHELLYNEFRSFGKLQNIKIDAKKETATIVFSSLSAAIAGRNCLHMKTIGDTKYNIRYDPVTKIQHAMEVVSNPRILIPLLGVTITSSIYLLVGPARVASVTQKVTRGHREEHVVTSEFRDDLFQKYQHQFRTPPNGSITIITGTSGTGKSLFLKKILHNRRWSVRVECRNIKTVNDFIEVFGESIGFSPSFSSLNTVYNWLESFVPGLKKTALSQSTKIQLQSMLRTLDQVLFLVTASFPGLGEREYDYPVIIFDGFHEMLDSWEKGPDAEREKSKELIETLLNWTVPSAQRSHLVFTGENIFGEESLLTHPILQRCKVNVHHLSDLPYDQVAKSLKKHLKLSDEEVAPVIPSIGGRIADLEAFIAKVNSGSKPTDVAHDMIADAETTIRNVGFGGKFLTASGRKWNPVQLWKAIKTIVAHGSVRYDEMLFLSFNGDNDALQALISNKIFTAEKVNGVLFVYAFSSLYLKAFERLVKDSPKLKRGMDIAEKKADIAKDMDEINKIEDELIKLQDHDSGIPSIKRRRDHLYTQLSHFNTRVETKETELRAIEKT